MSDYTPNWAEIKIHFVRSATDSTNSIAVMNEHEEMADRWLAQHEAKIVKQTEERIIALIKDLHNHWGGMNEHDPDDCDGCEIIKEIIKGETK